MLAGALPTPSGFGTVASVPEPDAQQLLRSVIEALPEPVIVHCCAPKAPIGLLSGAGALALALDVAMIGTHTAALDTIGEIWDAGIPVLLGLVPSHRGGRARARPALTGPPRAGPAIRPGRVRP